MIETNLGYNPRLVFSRGLGVSGVMAYSYPGYNPLFFEVLGFGV
jgi:hypothetical protein